MMEASVRITGKLHTTEEDFLKLKKTIETFREVCNNISEIAFNERCFNSIGLHHLTYKDIRIKYNLPANLVVRARDKVVSTYKKEPKKKHIFKGLNMDLDQRLLSIKLGEEIIVSIATVEKRIKTKFVIESDQKELLKYPMLKAKLVLRANEFYLQVNVREGSALEKNSY